MSYIDKRKCNRCGKYYEGRGKKFCSPRCSSLGRRHTSETIKNMKESATGRKNPRTAEWTEKIAKRGIMESEQWRNPLYKMS